MAAEDPTLEAYSRVTNSNRFGPLHDIGLELVDTLEAKFEVMRKTGYGLDAELENRLQLARPSIILMPANNNAAPIAFVFSTYPGIYLRMGRWYTDAFPRCGCDACNESVEVEAARLRFLIGCATTGNFRETIFISETAAWMESVLWSDDERSEGTEMLEREMAERLVASEGRRSYEWPPWPMRP